MSTARPGSRLTRQTNHAVPTRVDVEFDPENQITTGRLVAEVDARACELAPFVDPQGWGWSPYFPETYKVQRLRRAYRRDLTPPALGSAWKGLLYEHFLWKVGSFQLSWIFNILNVNFRIKKGCLDLEYSLHRPLGGGTWFSPRTLGVDIDSGYLRAIEGKRTTRLEICKTLRFVELDDACAPAPGNGIFGRMINLCTPGALEIWLRDVAAAWSPPR